VRDAESLRRQLQERERAASLRKQRASAALDAGQPAAAARAAAAERLAAAAAAARRSGAGDLAVLGALLAGRAALPAAAPAPAARGPRRARPAGVMPADDVLAGLRGAADALRDPDAAAALIRANNADPHCTGFLSRTIRDVAVQLHALQVRTAACEAARAACAAALGPRALEYRRARVCEARACAAVDEMTLCAALRLAAGVAAPLLALRGVFAAVVLAAHSLLMCCGTGAHPVISEAHGFAKMRQQQQVGASDGVAARQHPWGAGCAASPSHTLRGVGCGAAGFVAGTRSALQGATPGWAALRWGGCRAPRAPRLLD
jgi:hypothetical protein